MNLHDELLLIQAHVDKGTRTTGICAGVSSRNDNEYEELVEQWPQYSGKSCYPVPDTDGLGFYTAIGHEAMYNSPYGLQRRNLLTYLLDATKPKDIPCLT